MGMIKSLAGLVRVEITSASLADTLSELNHHAIILMNVTYLSELSIQAYVYRTNFRSVCNIVEKSGGTVKLKGTSGFYWQLKGYSKRPVLIFGLLLCIALTLFIPSRVLFVKVEGNVAVPTQLIIENAQMHGVFFGASRRNLRSEQIKNALLSDIPQLQWVGVNTSGCTAIISVRERTINEKQQNLISVSSIVAQRDGIIRDLTVVSGNALCKVGQAVKEGQVLVSGYTDCGFVIKTTRAQAEITAQTLRNLELVTPMQSICRDEIVSSKTTFSLQVGKKLIKFSNDSGISDTGCVKMYTKRYVTLPGGFALPLAFICEQTIAYKQERTASSFFDEKKLNNYAVQYLNNQMIAGQILQQDILFIDGEDVRCLNGNYNCLEMIGKEVGEEFIQKNG